MQTIEATQFINRLFKEFWNQPDPTKLGEFYQANLVGYFGDTQINFNDVKKRAEFCQQKFASIQNEILEVISEANKIVVRLKQTCIGKDAQDSQSYHLIGIYHLENNKISKVWFLSDKWIDYKQKA